MKLKFTQKTVYGNLLFYPANEAAAAICRVASRTTFSKTELQTLSVVFEVDIDADVFQLKKTSKTADQVKGE